MPILDGQKVDAAQITPEKHQFIGMWRPPVPPSLRELGQLLNNRRSARAGTDCACGVGIYSEPSDYLRQIREHWREGCYDEAQYISLPTNRVDGIIAVKPFQPPAGP